MFCGTGIGAKLKEQGVRGVYFAMKEELSTFSNCTFPFRKITGDISWHPSREYDRRLTGIIFHLLSMLR